MLIRIFAPLFLVVFTHILALDPKYEETIDRITHYADLDVVDLHLSNGLKVVLKNLETNDTEIAIRLSGLGGYAHLEENEAESAKKAGDFLCKRGIGSKKPSQFYTELYYRGIKYTAKILPYSRYIEIRCHKDQTDFAFELINTIFNEKIQCDAQFDNFFKEKLTEEEQCKLIKYANQAFQFPDEFTVVVVGKLDSPKTLNAINTHLASIEKGHTHWLHKAPVIEPPKEQYIRTVKTSPTHSLATTTLSFPISVEISPTNYQKLRTLANALKILLQNDMHYPLHDYQLNIHVLLPHFPCREFAQINITFFSNPNDVGLITQEIFSHLEHYSTSEINQNVWMNARKQITNTTYLELDEKKYWLSHLTTYSLWRWKLDKTQGNTTFCNTPECMIRCLLYNNAFHIKTIYPASFI